MTPFIQSVVAAGIITLLISVCRIEAILRDIRDEMNEEPEDEP